MFEQDLETCIPASTSIEPSLYSTPSAMASDAGTRFASQSLSATDDHRWHNCSASTVLVSAQCLKILLLILTSTFKAIFHSRSSPWATLRRTAHRRIHQVLHLRRSPSTLITTSPSQHNTSTQSIRQHLRSRSETAFKTEVPIPAAQAFDEQDSAHCAVLGNQHTFHPS